MTPSILVAGALYAAGAIWLLWRTLRDGDSSRPTGNAPRRKSRNVPKEIFRFPRWRSNGHDDPGN